MTDKSRYFQCVECFKYFTAAEWDEETENTLGRDIVPIELKETGLEYVCPECGTGQDGDDITEWEGTTMAARKEKSRADDSEKRLYFLEIENEILKNNIKVLVETQKESESLIQQKDREIYISRNQLRHY
ncbi:hypothetical protein [Paenibacillus sp. S29]|uniref:hypothetical protein n=1 Tax=Paenibacillus sp. S29 TaxID=3394611 RepID=UPI0039BF4B55